MPQSSARVEPTSASSIRRLLKPSMRTSGWSRTSSTSSFTQETLESTSTVTSIAINEKSCNSSISSGTVLSNDEARDAFSPDDSQPLPTDDELNDLAASVTRAEIMGDKVLILLKDDE